MVSTYIIHFHKLQAYIVPHFGCVESMIDVYSILLVQSSCTNLFMLWTSTKQLYFSSLNTCKWITVLTQNFVYIMCLDTKCNTGEKWYWIEKENNEKKLRLFAKETCHVHFFFQETYALFSLLLGATIHWNSSSRYWEWPGASSGMGEWLHWWGRC